MDFNAVFGRPFVKWFALCNWTVVLSVWNVGVLWPNDWIDQDESWHAGRPRPRRLCVKWGPRSPPQKGTEPPFQFASHVYCGQTAAWMKMPLGKVVGLGPDYIVYVCIMTMFWYWPAAGEASASGNHLATTLPIVPNYISNPPFPYAAYSSASSDHCQLNEVSAASSSSTAGKWISSLQDICLHILSAVQRKPVV